MKTVRNVLRRAATTVGSAQTCGGQNLVYGISADVTSIPAGYSGGVKGITTAGHPEFEGYGSCPRFVGRYGR